MIKNSILALILALTPLNAYSRVISGQTTTTSNASGYSMTGTHITGSKFAMDVNIVGGGAGGGPVTTVDGGNVVLGSTTDVRTTLTDATSVSIMSVLKQISFSAQNPPTQAVTGSGSFTVVQGTGTNLHTVVDSGTVTANIGTIGTIATESTLSAQNTLIGAVTETAPSTDTASSGLNGRLQRIAQRLTTVNTTLGSPFQAGGSIGNTSFGISGTLPAYASTPTFNIGTISTIATESTLSAQNTLIGAVTETAPASDTASSGLNGRLQRIAQRLTSFIALFTSTNTTPGLSDTTIAVRTIPYEPQTYRASSVAFVPPASATDVCTLTGSASKTIRVTRAFISGTTTSGSAIKLTVQWIKRSTADTGGTAISATAFALDSNNSAATATVNHYTANPTLGTTVGVIKAISTSVQATGLTSNESSYEEHDSAQPVVLRGTSQQMSINLNGTSVTGPVFSCTWEWVEI